MIVTVVITFLKTPRCLWVFLKLKGGCSR